MSVVSDFMRNWIRNKSFWALLGIVLLGIALRLLFIAVFPHMGEDALMDTTRYLNVSLNILTGRGFAEYITGPTAFAPPIYPYFLAGVFKVFGYNMIHAKIVQAVISGLTCLVVFWIGCSLFGRKIGLLAALGAAVFPDLIILSGYLYSETVYILLFCLSFLFILKGCEELHGWWNWIIGGIFFGLSILTRHALLMFPVGLLLLMVIFKSTRIYWKKLLLFCGICFVMIVPWTIRNYLCFHEIIPVAAGSGGTFWIGSYTDHEGEFRYSETMEKIDEETDSVRVDIERDKILINKAIDNITSNPLGYILVVAKKFGQYFTKIYEAVPAGQPRNLDIIVMLVLALSYYPLFLLFLLGIILSGKRWSRLIPLYSIILYLGGIYAMTVVVPRYRVPLLPFFMVFAALSVTHLWDKCHSLKTRNVREEAP